MTMKSYTIINHSTYTTQCDYCKETFPFCKVFIHMTQCPQHPYNIPTAEKEAPQPLADLKRDLKRLIGDH